jgi:hypothetical protein
MRFALVRGWAVLATAILTGAVADAATEFAENSRWLSGSMRDDQHQAVLPALAIGAAIALALLLFVVLARILPRDPLLLRMNDARRRSVDIAAALCGSALCVVAMEGFETRFGGLSPFDPRSVVLSHTFALIVAFAIVGTLLHYLLGNAIRFASRAGTGFTGFVAAFLRKRLHGAPSARDLSLSIFDLYVLHTPLDVTAGSRGLRAPPGSILLLNLITT